MRIWWARLVYLWRLLRTPQALDVLRVPPTVTGPIVWPATPTDGRLQLVLLDAAESTIHGVMTLSDPALRQNVFLKGHGPKVPPTLYRVHRVDAAGRWLYREVVS